MKQNEIDFQHPSILDQIRFYSLVVMAGILMVVAYQFGSPAYYLGWFAFFISAFSVAGNDAVQTVGTFIESKRTVHWILKLVVLGGIVVVIFLVLGFGTIPRFISDVWKVFRKFGNSISYNF